MNQLTRIPTAPLKAEEKQACTKTIALIMTLSQKTRTEGLLSLEDCIQQGDHPFFLKKGVSLIVDGYAPTYVQEILGTYILTGNFDGLELVQRQLTLSGLLCIQAGENPRLIQEQLLPYLGENFHDEACRLLAERQEA